MKEFDWHEDWKVFIEKIGDALNNNRTDFEISEMYGENQVTWVGKVKERLCIGESTAVRMDMPAKIITLSDGRYFTGDYLCLNLNNNNVKHWEKVKEGATVQFRTTLQKTNGPFPGIRWSANKINKGGVVLIGTRDGTLIQVIE